MRPPWRSACARPSSQAPEAYGSGSVHRQGLPPGAGPDGLSGGVCRHGPRRHGGALGYVVRPHVPREHALLRCAQPSTVPGAGHHASQQHIEHVHKQIGPRSCAAGRHRPAGGAGGVQQGGDRRQLVGRRRRQGRQRGRRRRPGLLAQRPAGRVRQAVPRRLQRRPGVRHPRHRQGGGTRDPRHRAGRRG
ncbi:hypothetical protein SCOCK_110134 [Actinacidiphila cocklensis]|uniref:Uncharacterized protein n=1 Tax=Actinacidiphila cocklensis TaxID=887465 RepID=A0A9W4DH81_9ACTN|nr:hypothetical protein SCOCK_110134 [Actinacidiphila cocklensis]